MAAALAGVAGVFSAAPVELLPDVEADLAAAAKGAGVTRIVKLSGMGVEQDPTSLHRRAELAIEASGVAWTFLRANFFMQNYATMAAEGIRSGAIYEPAGDGATSFVDTRDIAAVAVLALTQPGHDGRAYVMTGPEALTRDAVAGIIAAATGKTVRYVPVDDAALRHAMAAAPSKLVELMSGLMGYVREGYTSAVSPDIGQLLGRAPTSFAQFAKDHVAAWT